jgi:nucleoside-diphosphate-sugar epimerase
MRRATVCGAGGFIGHHLVGALKRRGYWVRAVDLEAPAFSESLADEFLQVDLRRSEHCDAAVAPAGGHAIDEVYQLAADMGGMGFIEAAECDIMTNNALINIHMVGAAARAQVGRYFFSSSACVYRDQPAGDAWMDEGGAYPAQPDNEYGWEKLYAERMAMAFARNHELTVRIARFQNCFGPDGTWQGGREKAPAAICRKVAMAKDGDAIEVWGDGRALRNYIYVADLCEGIYRLMHSDVTEPTNIGTTELVSVDDLVRTVASVAGVDVEIRYVPGPVGVAARYHRIDRIESLGWAPQYTLRQGLEETYPWVLEQVRRFHA